MAVVVVPLPIPHFISYCTELHFSLRPLPKHFSNPRSHTQHSFDLYSLLFIPLPLFGLRSLILALPTPRFHLQSPISTPQPPLLTTRLFLFMDGVMEDKSGVAEWLLLPHTSRVGGWRRDKGSRRTGRGSKALIGYYNRC